MLQFDGASHVVETIISDLPQCRHQVLDIPEERYSPIEHQLFAEHYSDCGKYHAALTPSSVSSWQSPKGPNLIALIAHLSGRYHWTVRQIQDYLQKHWKLRLSLGISPSQAKATKALAEPYRQIGEHVRGQSLAHAVETHDFRRTECRWLWMFLTQEACYFLTHYSRGKVAADTLLGNIPGFLLTYDYAG